jgi:hypothetical protein
VGKGDSEASGCKEAYDPPPAEARVQLPEHVENATGIDKVDQIGVVCGEKLRVDLGDPIKENTEASSNY